MPYEGANLDLVRRVRVLDGVRLSYLERGTPQDGSPSVVLLHGLTACAETFVPLLQHFGDARHLIALDLPGAGASERRARIDAGLAATADLVARFLQALGLHKPVLLGHSHGGAVAMSLAARHGDLLHSIVLLAPAHPWFHGSNSLIRFYRTLPGRLFAYSMPWYPQWVQLIGLRGMAGPEYQATPERLRPYRENLRTPGTIPHLLRLLRTWHADMAELALDLRGKPLTVPALLLWGDCDATVSVHSASSLRQNLGYSELVVLLGIGHLPAEETPAVVVRMMDQWLETCHTRAAPAPGYSANSVPTQPRTAALITPSFEAGDRGVPAKK